MRIDVHAPHGRRWVVERHVLDWRPRKMGAGLLDDLPGDRRALRAEVSGVRARDTIAGFQGWVHTSTATLVVVPLYVLQGVAWVGCAAAVWLFRQAARAPWEIRASSRHPKPLHHEERVVGWGASGRRAKQLAAELTEGTNSALNPA